jgi:hypothetical protein
MGDFVIGYAESDRSAVDVVAAWAEQATEIDRFFVATVKEVHGIDLTDVPEGQWQVNCSRPSSRFLTSHPRALQYDDAEDPPDALVSQGCSATTCVDRHPG